MYVIPSIGSLELRVTADPANTSQILRLDITDAGGVVTSFQPTVAVTTDVEPTPTEIAPTPTPQKPSEVRHQEGKPAVSDWLLVNLMIVGVCASLGYLGQKLKLKLNLVIPILMMGVGGYLAYFYLAVGLPGAESPINATGTSFILLISLIGMVVGLMVGFLLEWHKTRRK